MTEAEVYDHVVAFLNDVNDSAKLLYPSREYPGRVIKAQEGAPELVGPYASVMLNSRRDLEEVDCEIYRQIALGSRADQPLLDKTRAVEWLFRVEIWATHPTDAASAFTNALRSGYAALGLSPLVMRRIYNATRAPGISQQHWEGRANFDFTVAGLVTETTLTEFVEGGSVDFDGSSFQATATFQKGN